MVITQDEDEWLFPLPPESKLFLVDPTPAPLPDEVPPSAANDSPSEETVLEID
jgi:hypothetical protein